MKINPVVSLISTLLISFGIIFLGTSNFQFQYDKLIPQNVLFENQVSIQNDYDADRGNIGRYGNIQRKQSEFISKTNELTLFATGLEERTTSSRHSGGSNGISGGV